MDKWNIEVALTDNDDDLRSSPEVCIEVPLKSAAWRSVLSAAVARLYDCDVAITSTGPIYYIHISGSEDNLVSCRLHILHLQNQIEHSFRFLPSNIWNVRALGAARYVLYLIDQHLTVKANRGEPEPLESSEPMKTDAAPCSAAMVRLETPIIHIGPEEPRDGSLVELDISDMSEHEQSLGIRDIARSLRHVTTPHPALEVPLEASSIDAGTVSALRSSGHMYLGDIAGITKRQLQEIEGITSNGASSVVTEMFVQGLRLRADVEE